MLSSFSEFITTITEELSLLLPGDIVMYIGGIILVMLVLAAWRLVS